MSKNKLVSIISYIGNKIPLNNLSKVIYQNDKFKELFDECINSNLDYTEFIQQTNTLLSQNNMDLDFINDNTILTKMFSHDKNIHQKIKNNFYENSLFKEILLDLLNNEINFITYQKIISSNLFDERYYKLKYNYYLKVPAIFHYLYMGENENTNPSSFFDGDFYKNYNKNAKKSNLNPLVYFVLRGMDEGVIKINESFYQPKAINKIELREKINNFKDYGLNITPRDKQVIVSLTSYPSRLNDCVFAVYSLLNQEIKPDKVILWLSVEEFPNKEEDVSENILNFKENGLEIKWCKNLKPYNKLIYSLKEYPNDILVIADDDVYYSQDWLKKLYETYNENPEDIIAHRTRKIIKDENGKIEKYNNWPITTTPDVGYDNMITGVGGVLFPPKSLYEDVTKEEIFTKICRYSDDLWYWGMSILNKTKVRIVKNNDYELTYISPVRDILFKKDTLWSYNKHHNDENFKNMIKTYPEIMIMLEKSLEQNNEKTEP